MVDRNRNRRQIERFLVFYDNIFPATVGFFSVEEMQGKPESSPPIPDTDRVWDFLEDEENRNAALYLHPIFEEMKREAPPLWHIAGVVAGWVKPMIHDDEPDHGTLRRWRAKETEKDKAGAALFDRAVAWVETRLYDKYPKVEIKVVIPKHDNPLQGLVHQRNIDTNALKKWDAQNAYRQIDADIKTIIEQEDCTVEAAIGLYRDRLERNKLPDVCVRKIKTARAFVKKEAEIKQIMKEKNCSVEAAIDLYGLRAGWERRGA